MDSQAMCDRMKQICIENGLPIWEEDLAFNITTIQKEHSLFWFDKSENEFFVVDLLKDELLENYNKVNETEFLQLLKEYNDERL